MAIRGDRIRQRREELGLSQPQLCARVNEIAGETVCTQQSIHNAETGKARLPRYAHFMSLALGVSLGWLLGLVDDPGTNAHSDEFTRRFEGLPDEERELILSTMKKFESARRN